MAEQIFPWMEDPTLEDINVDESLVDSPDINVDDSYWSDFWGGLNNVLGSQTTKNLLNFGSGIYGMFEADKMKHLSENALKASDPFGKYRGIYGDQLLALMADPSSVTKLPGYQFQFDQGAEAVSRKMASRGYAGSGNMGTALTEYGQKFAESYFDREATRLATLAGANIAPNFGAGLGGYGGGIDIASQALASLGYGSTMAGQGTSRPNAAGGEAAAVGKTISAGGNLLAGLGAKDAGSAVSNVGGLISGVSKGGVGGYAQAAKAGTNLASQAGVEVPSNVSGAVETAGSLANIYTGIEQGGVGGYAKAASGVADLAGYDIPYLGYVDAATKVAKGDVGGGGYSAMITAAGPIAAVGSAIADAFNRSGDKKSAATSAVIDYMVANQGFKYTGGRTPTIILPDGKSYIRPGNEARAYSEAIRKGDAAAAQTAWDAWMATAKPWYGS